MKSIEGIILKKTPRREADVVFTLYTKEHGLMELQAKSVRQAKGKLKAGLDLFNYAEIFFVPAKYWPIITDFKIKDDFKVIKNDLYRLRLAHFAAEAVLKIFEPGAGEEVVWQKIFDLFSGLDTKYVARAGLGELVYRWCYHILDLNGLNPRAPDFKSTSMAHIKRRTEDLFQYHFGVNLGKLV